MRIDDVDGSTWWVVANNGEGKKGREYGYLYVGLAYNPVGGLEDCNVDDGLAGAGIAHVAPSFRRFRSALIRLDMSRVAARQSATAGMSFASSARRVAPSQMFLRASSDLRFTSGTLMMDWPVRLFDN